MARDCERFVEISLEDVNSNFDVMTVSNVFFEDNSGESNVLWLNLGISVIANAVEENFDEVDTFSRLCVLLNMAPCKFAVV